eukprot:9194601-Pyramimonas_sp.AAC.1
MSMHADGEYRGKHSGSAPEVGDGGGGGGGGGKRPIRARLVRGFETQRRRTVTRRTIITRGRAKDPVTCRMCCAKRERPGLRGWVGSPQGVSPEKRTSTLWMRVSYAMSITASGARQVRGVECILAVIGTGGPVQRSKRLLMLCINETNERADGVPTGGTTRTFGGSGVRANIPVSGTNRDREERIYPYQAPI